MDNYIEVSNEQQIRNILERMDVPRAQEYSAGDLVELANILMERNWATQVACEIYATLRTAVYQYKGLCKVDMSPTVLAWIGKHWETLEAISKKSREGSDV